MIMTARFTPFANESALSIVSFSSDQPGTRRTGHNSQLQPSSLTARAAEIPIYWGIL